LGKWEQLTPDKQQKLYDRIKQKIQSGKYVDYNPLEAMHDNMPREKILLTEPIDYNGKQINPPEPVEIACYNGHWGMYTQSDIQLHKMQTKH
jgi:hypothetical protein